MEDVKITKDIFTGEKKSNAKVFIDSLDRVRAKHMRDKGDDMFVLKVVEPIGKKENKIVMEKSSN